MLEPELVLQPEKPPIQVARERLFQHYANCKSGDPAHIAIATNAKFYENAAIDNNPISTPEEKDYAQRQIDILKMIDGILSLIIPGYNEAVKELNPFVQEYQQEMEKLALGDKEERTATMLKELARDIRSKPQIPLNSLNPTAL